MIELTLKITEDKCKVGLWIRGRLVAVVSIIDLPLTTDQRTLLFGGDEIVCDLVLKGDGE